MREKPKHTLTNEQQVFVLNNYKKLKRQKISDELKTSRASVSRVMCDFKLYHRHNKWENQPEIVKEVLDYYKKHGVKKTNEKFKDISVRSIIERYKNSGFIPHWKFEDDMFLLRYLNSFSYDEHVKILKKHHIVNSVSTICKHLSLRGYKNTVYYNEIPHRFIKKYILEDTPIQKQNFGKRKKCVQWIDIANFWSSDNVDLYRLAMCMAKFQIWLHGGLPITNREDILIYERKDL